MEVHGFQINQVVYDNYFVLYHVNIILYHVIPYHIAAYHVQ